MLPKDFLRSRTYLIGLHMLFASVEASLAVPEIVFLWNMQGSDRVLDRYSAARIWGGSSWQDFSVKEFENRAVTVGLRRVQCIMR